MAQDPAAANYRTKKAGSAAGLFARCSQLQALAALGIIAHIIVMPPHIIIIGMPMVIIDIIR